jgi:hypothetical protein
MPTGILVIENGTMIESGRHDELLRKSGRYAVVLSLAIARAGARRGGMTFSLSTPTTERR